ncbi:MAG TPA: bifunctional adenosylcobinamide kinase/adenosylcobinamide-phosphate guanylyltransferase [Pedobacter sp.]|nr:bifunctional adenosylcobinamide kinase/adenosylcobinamide-phosphate guanylyltransferase [Pedobacter sp.]
MIYYITGGERSGKSKYAQELALRLSDNPVYIATARIWDKDFEKRIERHQNERDERWINIEEEKYISKAAISNKVAVIDCVTLWLTNIYTDTKFDIEEALKEAKAEFDKWEEIEATLIIISNEIGMGVHAATEMGRKFVELQGWVNQYIANKANKAILMISGIPVNLKD